MRIVLRSTELLAALLVCVPLHYLWQTLRQSSPWPRLFLAAAARIVGARIERTGRPLKRNVIYIANHVSWLDILVIAGTSGSAFVAKAEIGTAPVVGWLSKMNRTVFVSREDRLGVAQQIDRLREALAENWSVTIFPEGTTTDGRSLLPFKSPLLKVLEPPPPDVRVQPLLLDYGSVSEELGWIGVEHGRDNALRILARRGSFRAGIVFLTPFDPADFPGRKAIAAESKARICAAFAKVLGAPVPNFIGHDFWAGTALPIAPESGSATPRPAL